MNKGLEVMEAHHLFGTPYDRIDVVVHPQSIIHALVQLCDGSTKAHMGYPDMRVAIGYALHHPDRADLPIPALDLVKLQRLDFEAPDLDAFPCLRLAREAALAGGTAPCALNAANEVAVHAFLNGRLTFQGIPAVIERVLDTLGAMRVHDFEALYVTDSEARAAGRRDDRDRSTDLSWVLAFLGFAALVVLHEAGHFFAAKAVGMRVERFALFFPPLIARYKRGETEYAIGAIPLGGYVKITGMNPAEEIPPEHAHRAYYRQPVWKRIVVIAAGPFVNIALAFVILSGVYMSAGDGRAAARRRRDQQALAGGADAAPGRRAARRRRPQADQRYLPRAAGRVREGDRGPQGHAGLAHRAPRRRRADGERQHVLRQDAEEMAVRLRLRPRGERPGCRAVALQRTGREPDVARHLHHGEPHRADLRAREAQGTRQRRRRLRADPPGVRALDGHRVRDPRRSSRCRWA